MMIKKYILKKNTFFFSFYMFTVNGFFFLYVYMCFSIRLCAEKERELFTTIM